MTGYTINTQINGYIKSDISNEELLSDNEKEVIVVLKDSSVDTELDTYYNTIRTMIRGRKADIYLISVDNTNKVFKPLAMLMVGYGLYNIYQVASEKLVTTNYIMNIKKRETSYEEVLQYVDSDITSYDELDSALTSITRFVDNGNIDGLVDYVQKYQDELSHSKSAVAYMKGVCQSYNSADLVKKIKKNEDEIIDLKNKNKAISGELNSAIEGKKISDNRLSETEKQLRSANSRLSEIKNAGGVVSGSAAYQDVDTSTLKCNILNIIYIKEVSYVRYMNTFMLMLKSFIESKHMKVKIVIYDNRSGMLSVYNPLPVVGNKVYMGNQEKYLFDSPLLVAAEFLDNFYPELLKSQGKYDILIVYDRMGAGRDIIRGNNVRKFFVLNSANEFTKLGSSLGVTNEINVISSEDSDFTGALKIRAVPGYRELTEAKKRREYYVMPSGKDENGRDTGSLMNSFLTRAGVNR